jgi:ubiquinone/menaquinone biosynthesis C-methylase UbiE
MSSENSVGRIYPVIKYFLKIFFNLLYHQFAWTYDWVAELVSLGHWKSWVYSVLPYLEDSKVLELGCGPGHLQLALSQKKISSFGIDSSREMVRIAANRMSNKSQFVNIIHGKSQSLPFPDHSFNKVVATFPSDYISDYETLSQAWRVLDDSGELIILLAAWIAGKSWWERLAAWTFRITGQAPVVDQLNIDENSIYPLSTLQEIGFQIDKEIIELESSKLILIHAEKMIPKKP